MRHILLRGLRKILQQIETRLVALGRATAQPHPGNGRTAEIEAFLRALPLDEAGRAYLETHRARLARTFSLVPPGGQRALELGSYVYSAALLERVLGYAEVRGAYYAAAPGHDRKTIALAPGAAYALELDLFDAERHAFPYEEARFDLVLCCELIEHLTLDPMHLLFECHRVLREGGLLLLTTPNVASLHGLACVLQGWHNPQVFSAYPPPGNVDSPHVREYTARELRDAVTAAGFEIEALFTEPIAGLSDGHSWVRELLEREGLDPSLRGEQTYCLARRRASLPRERRPAWLYAG